jgi:hypothetical protein
MSLSIQATAKIHQTQAEDNLIRCKCVVPGCDKQRQSLTSGWYCDDHACSHQGCINKKDLCPRHRNGAQSKPLPASRYRCTIPGCSSSREDNTFGWYCRAHVCRHPGCHSDDEWCPKHGILARPARSTITARNASGKLGLEEFPGVDWHPCRVTDCLERAMSTTVQVCDRHEGLWTDLQELIKDVIGFAGQPPGEREPKQRESGPSSQASDRNSQASGRRRCQFPGCGNWTDWQSKYCLQTHREQSAILLRKEW